MTITSNVVCTRNTWRSTTVYIIYSLSRANTCQWVYQIFANRRTDDTPQATMLGMSIHTDLCHCDVAGLCFATIISAGDLRCQNAMFWPWRPAGQLVSCIACWLVCACNACQACLDGTGQWTVSFVGSCLCQLLISIRCRDSFTRWRAARHQGLQTIPVSKTYNIDCRSGGGLEGLAGSRHSSILINHS